MIENRIYILDKTLKIENNGYNKKYIARSYNNKGEIQYFEEDQAEDGFDDIIKDLCNGNEVLLYTSNERMKATIEFLNELKFSVGKAVLTLIFKDEKDEWTKVKYKFI